MNHVTNQILGPDALLNIQAEFAEVGNRSLASIIADLLNENEPLLKAECRGADVLVSERGGSGRMIVKVREA